MKCRLPYGSAVPMRAHSTPCYNECMKKVLSPEIRLQVAPGSVQENPSFEGYTAEVVFVNNTPEPSEVIKSIHVKMSEEVIADLLEVKPKDPVTTKDVMTAALYIVEERYKESGNEVLDEDALICSNKLGIHPLHLRELGQ